MVATVNCDPPNAGARRDSRRDGSCFQMSKRLTQCAKIILCLALAAPVSATVAGCAALSAVAPALPAIAGVISDAVAVLSLINVAVQQFMRQHQVPLDVQEEYAALHAKTIRALNAANAALRGARNVSQKEFDAAFNEFFFAFSELRELLIRQGMMTDGKMAVGTGAVTVPEPAALTFKVK